MGYRDLDTYRPDQPEIPPPTRPRLRPRFGSSGYWAAAAGIAVLVAGAAWRAQADPAEPAALPTPLPRAVDTREAMPITPLARSIVAQPPEARPALGTASTPSAEPSVEPSAAYEARTAVTGFVSAWAHPRWSREKWLAQVTPYATAELAADLETTDPRNVPATTIISVTAESATDTHAAYLVVTDGARVRVVANSNGGRWKVASVEAVRRTRLAVPSTSPIPGTPSGTKG